MALRIGVDATTWWNQRGFGLPAAEAIACRVPVIATQGGAVAEVVGGAGLFFDPPHSDDMAHTIVKVAADASVLDRLKQKCLPRSAELSWTNSAARMLDLLETHARKAR